MTSIVRLGAAVLSAILIAGFAFLSLRGMLDPHQASVRFGWPTVDPSGDFFYRIYLSRNLVIVVTGAVFLIARMWQALAIMMTVAVALPVFDLVTLILADRPAPPLHLATVIAVSLVAAVLWARVRLRP